MDIDRRKLETVETLAPAIVPFAKLLASHQMSLRHTKKQKEMELEIAEKQHEMREQAVTEMQNVETTRSPRSNDRDGRGGGRIDALIEEEDCDVCEAMLRHIDTLDGDRREKGIAEYGRLKETMNRAEDEDEVRDFIEETDVLSSALQRAV